MRASFLFRRDAWRGMMPALFALAMLSVMAFASMQSHAVPVRVTYADSDDSGFRDTRLGSRRRATFEAAAQNWGRRLGGTVPIQIIARFEAQGGTRNAAQLAGARPTAYISDASFSGAPVPDSLYPVALANQLAGEDLLLPSFTGGFNEDSSDIQITFNSSIDTNTALGAIGFYYGLDGNPTVLGTNADGSQITDIDFYTVAFHELCHGLGFVSLLRTDGAFNQNGPAVFDRYLTANPITTATSQRLFSLTAEERKIAQVNNQLYFAGPNARFAVGNEFNVRLFAPRSFQDGSSVSHLDEEQYSDDTDLNELMTPFLTGITHDPGPIVTGIFRDIGWTISDSNPTPFPEPAQSVNRSSGNIVYVSNRDGNNEIYFVRANGTGLTRLTQNEANDTEPAVSPNGRRIAFVSDREGNNDIYVLTVGVAQSATNPLRITISPGDDRNPTWSPDGKLLAFSSDRLGHREIYRVTAEGTGERRLTGTTTTESPEFTDTVESYEPTWSPDGTLIAFTSDEAGDVDIYTMTPTGQNVTRITDSFASDSQPAWNGMSTKLAYVSDRTGSDEIYTIEAEGATDGANDDGFTQVTRNFASESSPTFNPLADQIAFSSNLNGDADIYIINADGEKLIRLTANDGEDIEPSWGRTPTRPSNDSFSRAQLISGESGTLSPQGTNVDGSKEAGEPNHAGNPGGASIWYKYVAPFTGSITFSTLGSSFDTLLAVYTGTAVNALTPIAQNDDSPISGEGKSSRVTFNIVSGRTYYLAVDGANGAMGRVSLSWRMVIGPINDNFQNAINLTGNSGVLSSTSGNAVTNRNATKQAGEPFHAGNGGGASVWYKLTSATTRRVSISLAGSNFDTLLAVYTGTAVNALTLVAQNDDASASTNTSRVSFTASAGVTYRIAVDGFNGAQGNIVLRFSLQGRQPDALIRASDDVDEDGLPVFLGADIYNTTGLGQQVERLAASGLRRTFLVRVQNDGEADDSLTVRGPATDANLTITYFNVSNGVNITSLVTRAAGYQTGILAPGVTREIRIQVDVKATAATGARKVIKISATSGSDAARSDVVLATVSVVKRQPDAQINGPRQGVQNGEMVFLGDNIYNTTGSGQHSIQAATTGNITRFTVRLQNDGIGEDNLIVRGPGDDANFLIRYFSARIGGIDITARVTGTDGWPTGPLVSGAARDIRVEITARTTTAVNTVKSALISVTSATIAERRDAVIATVQVIKRQPDAMIRARTATAFVGGDVYSIFGTNESVAQTVAAGADATYIVRVESDSSVTDRFLITTTGQNDSRFRVRYFLAQPGVAEASQPDVTSRIVTGYPTSFLAPGATIDFRVVVTPFASTTSGAKSKVFVTASSMVETARKDTVVAITTVAARTVTTSTSTTSTSTTARTAQVALSSASANANAETVALSFTGALDPAVVVETAHYSVSVNGVAVEIAGAIYRDADQTVVLSLPAAALKSGDGVYIQWNGLRDSRGAAVADSATKVVAR